MSEQAKNHELAIAEDQFRSTIDRITRSQSAEVCVWEYGEEGIAKRMQIKLPGPNDEGYQFYLSVRQGEFGMGAAVTRKLIISEFMGTLVVSEVMTHEGDLTPFKLRDEEPVELPDLQRALDAMIESVSGRGILQGVRRAAKPPERPTFWSWLGKRARKH